MEKQNRYNGWTNYETWAVSLWFDNDESTYNQWTERAEELYKEAESTAYSTRVEVASSDLAKEMQDFVEEQNPLSDAGLFTDLLNAALSEVDWYEIADHYLSEVDKESVEAEEQWDKDNIFSKE